MTECTTGRCAYGTDCTCNHPLYRNWITVPPCPMPRRLRAGNYGAGYRAGWRQGYARGAHDKENSVA